MLKRALIMAAAAVAAIAGPVVTTTTAPPASTAQAIYVPDIHNVDDRYGISVQTSARVWKWINPGGTSGTVDIRYISVPYNMNVTVTVRNEATGAVRMTTYRGDQYPTLVVGVYDKITISDVYLR